MMTDEYDNNQLLIKILVFQKHAFCIKKTKLLLSWSTGTPCSFINIKIDYIFF